jgi:hypothetical protein
MNTLYIYIYIYIYIYEFIHFFLNSKTKKMIMSSLLHKVDEQKYREIVDFQSFKLCNEFVVIHVNIINFVKA